MPRARGFSLIEMMIALAIAAVLYSLASPMMVQWMADTRIRVTAETLQAGIQLARSEAIRRNAPVRFQLMTSLDEACAPSSTARNWVVSLDDASGKCGVDPSPTVAPGIIQTKSGQEGSSRVNISATRGGAAASSLTYTGTGRLSLAGNAIDTIDIAAPDGACQHAGGDFRCLRIRILPGGDARMCDPKVTAAGDLRRCP